MPLSKAVVKRGVSYDERVEAPSLAALQAEFKRAAYIISKHSGWKGVGDLS